MGLSASQARLLNLTARMHDIEYKAQNLEAQKLQMANESAHVYQEYEDALNKQKVQFKHIGTDGSAVYKDACIQDLLTGGYNITLLNGATQIALTEANKGTVLENTSFKDLDLNDPTTLRNLVEAGFIVFEKPVIENGVSKFTEVNIATDTNLQEVTDEVDLKKAEAKYEADMRKINQKDKKFDTDLARLENERNAIKTEMETLKTVAKENVERTFKLFG